MSRSDFQATLRELASEPVLHRLLAALPSSALVDMATDLARCDPYNEVAFISAALDRTGSQSGPDAVYAHQMWCAWREARWLTGALDASSLSITVEGQEWLNETDGHPTVMLTPMTVGLSDAAAVFGRCAGSRASIVYGEGIRLNDMPRNAMRLPIAEDGRIGIKHIRDTLAKNGIFCTYPDFVYGGHATLPVRLFGTLRPISAGYVALLAGRGDTIVVPAVLLRDGESIILRCQEPFCVPSCPDPNLRAVFRQQLADCCATHLEELIRIDPAQWLLLNTLTFEAPQMASRC
jgi:hypothetical protein